MSWHVWQGNYLPHILKFRGSPVTRPFKLTNLGRDGWFILRCINSSTDTFPSVKKIFVIMIVATHPLRTPPCLRLLGGSGGHSGICTRLGASRSRKALIGIGLSTSIEGLLGLGRFPPVNSITFSMDGTSSMDPPQAITGPSSLSGAGAAPWASQALDGAPDA